MNPTKICVVISDCDDNTIHKIRKCKLTNVFGKPPEDVRNEMSQCVADIRGWLAENTKTCHNGYGIPWWQKIKYHGLVMHFECVRMFNVDLNYQSYVKQRCFLDRFEKLLADEFGKSGLHDIIVNNLTDHEWRKGIDRLYNYKEKNLNLSQKWQSYANDNSKYSSLESEKHIIKAAVESEASLLLQIFIQFCIFNYEDSKVHDKQNKIKYNAWLNSEYLFIVNEQCNTYNQLLVDKLEKYMDENKENKSKMAVGYSDLEVNKMLDKLANCEITSYDFVSNCHVLFKIAHSYRERYGSYFDNNSPYIVQQNLKFFMKRYKLFCKRLFEQGTPVTFTDSLNNDINDEFVYHVFGALNSNKNSNKRHTSNVISVAIAGPQSSGKSTLLRRLFGINARVSAGKTTKGINCCRVGLNLRNENESKNDIDDVDLMLVDTEGINSIESSSMNSMENRKRNNKIMLGALASCNVFLFNIKNDPSDAKLLDVILWAYEKLDLKTAAVDSNKKDGARLQQKYLSDIKFIFVIRDVKEFTDTKWLEKQKRKVTEYLNESIKLCPKYIENEFNSINSIEDLIGEPEYFPMPNAFDSNDAPNPQFSQRCVELRDKILANFSNNDLSNRYGFKYDNALQWSKNMIGIWRSIVQLETILCVSDFREQSMIRLLRTAVKTQLNKLRDDIKERVIDIIQECLEGESNHLKRCDRFEKKITSLVHHERDKYLQDFDNNQTFKDMKISELTIETYRQEFRNQARIVILERKRHFHYKSRSKEALEIENSITRLLNNLANTLRNQEIKDDGDIHERYWVEIGLHIEAYEMENSKENIQKQIKKRFDQTYETQILNPNKFEGKSPSSLKSLTTFRKGHRIKYVNNAKNNSVDYNDEADRKKCSDKLSVKVVSHIDELVEDYIGSHSKEANDEKENKTSVADEDGGYSDIDINFCSNNSWDDAHAWCIPFGVLDRIMTNWDTKNYPKYAITEEYRCYAHGLLRMAIIKKVLSINEKNIKNNLARIKKIAKRKYDWFCKRVKTIQEDTEVGENVAKSIKSGIIVYCKESIDTFIYNTIENNCKHYESKIFLRRSFNDAFGKDDGSAGKAMKFIFNQADMIKKALKTEMRQISRNLLTKKQHKLKNCTLIEFERNEINNIVESMTNNLDQLDKECKNRNKSLTTIDVFKYLHGKPIHFAKDWDDCVIDQCDVFIKALKEEMNKFDAKNIMSDRFFREQFKFLFEQRHREFQETLLGCMQFCPFCNAKCQRKYGHGGRCKTNNHFLLAFSGKYSKKKNKLRINTCCSQSNMKRKWGANNLWNACVDLCNKYVFDASTLYSETMTWDETVKKIHTQWYPIKPTDFNKTNAQLMVDCFFNKGLQEALLKKYNANEALPRKLIEATEDDIEFADEISWNNFKEERQSTSTSGFPSIDWDAL